MLLIITTTIAAVVWLVLWALGAKSLDAGLVAILIMVVGIAMNMSSKFLPGKQTRG